MRVQTRAAFLLLSGLLLGCHAKEDDPALTYEAVIENPAKYRGKQVTWSFWPISSEGKRILCGLEDMNTTIGPRITGAFVVEFTSEKEVEDAIKVRGGGYTVTATVAGLVDQSLVGRDFEGVPQMALAKVTVPLLVDPTYKVGQGKKGKGKD
jgi:hypothetical protein